jgi:lysophospholipase L1-like esterase
VLVTEIFFHFVPISTFHENPFFILNRALDYPEVFKKDHDLFWRFRPSRTIRSEFFQGKEYQINGFGIRGPEIPPISRKIRIVTMGNSCTFGWGIPYDQTYAGHLETILNSDTTLPEVEVINCGIPGYSSFQGRRFQVSDVVDLKSDIILFMYAWNDQWAAADNIPDKDQALPSQSIIDIQNLLARLKIYALMRRLVLATIDDPGQEKLIKENQVNRVNTTDFYGNLNAMVHFAMSEGTIPILLTSPIPSLEKYYPPGSKSRMHMVHKDYNLQTRTLASNATIPLVDIALEFDMYDNLYDDAPIDPIHFNAEGHRITAEAIYTYLKNHDYLFTK